MLACANSPQSHTNTHDRPNTTLGAGCVWRWKIRTNGRSSAHTIADRAPSPSSPQSPCAHRLLPPRRTGGDAETLTFDCFLNRVVTLSQERAWDSRTRQIPSDLFATRFNHLVITLIVLTSAQLLEPALAASGSANGRTTNAKFFL